MCDRRVLDFIAEAGFQDIKEHLIPQLYRAGERVDVHICEPASQRVLDASSYLAVNQWAVENIVRQVVDAPRPYVRSGELVAHPTAEVHPNAVLVGPVLLGPSVRISDTARVVGPTTIGAETIVDRHALVSRSVVWKRCILGHHSVVDRCVLSDDVVVDPESQFFDLVKARRRQRLRAVLDLFRRPGRSMEPRTADVFSGSHIPSAPVSGPRLG